jgi:putative membrane protein
VVVPILAAVAVTVAGRIVAVRVLHARHEGRSLPDSGSEAAMADAARQALRMRYARGEISREDYLQGKVELED